MHLSASPRINRIVLSHIHAVLQLHRDALFYFNDVALEDADFGANFAYLFASQHIQGLNEQFDNREEANVIRSNILNMLQENYKGKFG